MSDVELGREEKASRSSKHASQRSYDVDQVPREPEISQPPVPQVDIPDGGVEAWTVIFGGFLAYFATFGVVNSYVSPYYTLPMQVVMRLLQRVYFKTIIRRLSSPIRRRPPSR